MGPLALAGIGAGLGIGGSLLGNFLDKSGGFQNSDYYEKIKALQDLSAFSSTGKIGSFTAGERYGQPTGNYLISPTEELATKKLYSSIDAGTPQSIQFGDSALMKLFGRTGDYFDVSSLKPNLDAYKDLSEVQTKRGFDAIKRNAAFSGNLYSTDTIRKMGDYQTQSNADINARLADLTQGYMQLQAQSKQNQFSALSSLLPQFYNSATTQENINNSRIGNAFNFGGLQRTLSDAKAKDAYSEWLRARQEPLIQLDTMKSLIGAEPSGYYEPSKWSGLLNALAGAGGASAGYGISKWAKA